MLLKRNRNNITPAKTNAPISQTCPKINNSYLSTENTELNKEAWTTSRGNNKSIFAS